LNYKLAEDAGSLCITFPYGRYLTVQAGGYGSRADRPCNVGLSATHALRSLYGLYSLTRVDERNAGAVIYTA